MELEEEIRRRADELVAVVVERLEAAAFTASGDTLEGDARHVILEYARDWRPDVIVLGSHGRSGLDRLVLGSVSENVLRHAACSVEVVRTPLTVEDGRSAATHMATSFDVGR